MKYKYYIPDCYWPASDGEGEYVSHESVCVINPTDTHANISFVFYFENNEPMAGFTSFCAAHRTHHIRLDKLQDEHGRGLVRGIPYAAEMSSDVKLYVQYSRCDTTQANAAFMTAIIENI